MSPRRISGPIAAASICLTFQLGLDVHNALQKTFTVDNYEANPAAPRKTNKKCFTLYSTLLKMRLSSSFRLPCKTTEMLKVLHIHTGVGVQSSSQAKVGGNPKYAEWEQTDNTQKIHKDKLEL